MDTRTVQVSGESVESPSLSAAKGEAAFELKFLLDERQARGIEEHIRDRLPLDPHGDPALDGAYRTTSLYLDTPEYDVFHRVAPHKRRKFRVRRYGTGPYLFLERKKKSNDRVRKRRTRIADEELALLAHPLSVHDWPANWFHQRLFELSLQPVCLVGYQRTAYMAMTTEGAVRLTLDRNFRGVLTRSWEVTPVDSGLAFLTEQAILELKFHSALPMLFKELIQQFQLGPSSVSKYRRCLQAWGMTDGRKEAVNA